jgi:hypothetical protein
MFAGRNLVIATKHQKELVIAPALEEALGVKCFVPKDFDTDQFGTFCGEVERKMSPLETAKLKCIEAMAATGCDLSVSSEGSFGPHPSLVFIPADDELLVFIDKKNNLEISVRELTTETNFSGRQVTSKEELTAFALSAKFPSHGLIMTFTHDGVKETIKGIQDWDLLFDIFDKHIHIVQSVNVETDMRAYCNPTRMATIKKAVSKLIGKIESVCPVCNTPGFGVTEVREGLPCSLCHCPTRSIRSHLYCCLRCNHGHEIHFPNGKMEEDPMYCDYCNP